MVPEPSHQAQAHATGRRVEGRWRRRRRQWRRRQRLDQRLQFVRLVAEPVRGRTDRHGRQLQRGRQRFAALNIRTRAMLAQRESLQSRCGALIIRARRIYIQRAHLNAQNCMFARNTGEVICCLGRRWRSRWLCYKVRRARHLAQKAQMCA